MQKSGKYYYRKSTPRGTEEYGWFEVPSGKKLKPIRKSKPVEKKFISETDKGFFG